VYAFFKTHAKNWAASSEPLNAELSTDVSSDCKVVSAGHAKHESTSWAAYRAIFPFLAEYIDRFHDARST
jgi:hypothetical protein